MRVGSVVSTIFSAIVAVCILMAHPAFSQTEQDQNPQDESARTATMSKYSDYYEGDLEESMHDDGYIKPTVERLSQLYWALAMMDLKDNEAIDGYLMIHECDLYKQFYMRDFELDELRKVTRDSIMFNISKFPTKFEVFLPVGLDRYDLGRGVFGVYSASQFVNAKRLEVSRNSASRRICNQDSIPKYPRNFILAFNRPFTLVDIPMSKEQAQEIIDFAEEDMKKGFDGKNFEFKSYSPLWRIVFLRIKVSITQYKEMASNYSEELVPVFFANIDGYQIYSDKDRTQLIYDYETDTKQKRARLESGIDRKKIEIPDGPLLEGGKKSEAEYIP